MTNHKEWRRNRGKRAMVNRKAARPDMDATFSLAGPMRFFLSPVELPAANPPRPKPISDASAVAKSMLLAGATVSQVCKATNLCRAAVARIKNFVAWKQSLDGDQAAA